MISQISNSMGWYPSLFNTSPTNNSQTNLTGITSLDNYVNQNATEQELNLSNQPDTSAYDLLNNISDTSSFFGITNLDQYSQNNYLINSLPTVNQYNQASQAYSLGQNYNTNLYSLSSQYDQSV